MEADKEIKVRRVPIQEGPLPEPEPEKKAAPEDNRPQGFAPGVYVDPATGKSYGRSGIVVRKSLDGRMVYMDMETGAMRVFKDGAYEVEAGRREKFDMMVEPGFSQAQMSDIVDGIQVMVQNNGRRTVSIVVEVREV